MLAGHERVLVRPDRWTVSRLQRFKASVWDEIKYSMLPGGLSELERLCPVSLSRD